MTISASITQSIYDLIGNNLGPFQTVWPFEQPTDVLVFVDYGDGPALLSSEFDYTLAGLAPLSSGGAVTLEAGQLPDGGWPAGSRITLQRATSDDQPSAFGELNTFSPEACEQAIDHVARQVQDLGTNALSAIAYRPGEVPAALPPKNTRRGMLAVWDVVGDASLTWADPTQLAKGNPGGNVLAVGLFTAISASVMPAGVDLFETTGWKTVGLGAARYALDSDQASPTASAFRVQTLDGIWWKLAEDRVTFHMAGAAGDGAQDDSAALNAASAFGKALVGDAGTYLINEAVTFTVPVTMEEGAEIYGGAAIGLAFNAGFAAPRSQVFNISNAMTVTFAPAQFRVGYPEWWGALPNGADCHAALTAAVVACPVTEMAIADYTLASTLIMQTANRILRGGNRHGDAAGLCTRILFTSALTDAIQIGPTAQPGGGVAAFPVEIAIEDLKVKRTTPVTANATLNICPAGIRMQFVQYARLTRVSSFEHSFGFIFSGTVNCRAEDCYAERGVAGTNGANDPYAGFFYDGAAAIGTNGGNQGLELVGCLSQVLNAPALTFSAGLYGFTGFADMEVHRLKAVAGQYGAYLDGTAAAANAVQNLHLVSPVFDQQLKAGISITNCGTKAAVNITDPYCCLAASGAAVAGIVVSTVAGQVQFKGGQVIGGANAGDVGVLLVNSTGIDVDLIIRDAHVPVSISAIVDCDLSPKINNPTNAAVTGGIYGIGANTSNTFRPRIMDTGGLFTYGVNITGAANARNEINCSGIDSAAIAAGSNNKLLINGAQITATGLSGTNLVSGVMT